MVRCEAVSGERGIGAVSGSRGGWLLAFDLSTPMGVLVLEGPGGTLWREIAGHLRVACLFTEVKALMQEAGIGREDVALLGVGRGPGSFTGVRVAVTAAKTLAFSLGVPLVAPESLAVRAAGIGISAREAFVAMDARRGEVYYAAYGIGDGGLERLLEPGVAAPEKAAADLAICLERAHGEVVLTGTAIDAYAHVWPQGLVVAASEPPGAGGLARLCREAAERGDIADPYELLPLYLRRPDVGRMGEEKRCAW